MSDTELAQDAAKQQDERTFEVGQEVETIHGEKITIVEIRSAPAKTKKGVVLEEGRKFIIAKSGGTRMRENPKTGVMEEVDILVQYPLGKIK